MTFLSKLKAKLLGSVDDIVGDFHKVADRLEARANLHAVESAIHRDAAYAHQQIAAFADSEKAKAMNVAAKIRNLVS